MNVACQTTQIHKSLKMTVSIYVLALPMPSPTSAYLAENGFSLPFVTEM